MRRTYRIDRMAEINILKEKQEGEEELAEYKKRSAVPYAVHEDMSPITN